MHPQCRPPFLYYKTMAGVAITPITQAIMLKSYTLSVMARALTRKQLQECQARQKEGESLDEHEEYALSLRSWTTGTDEKLAALIAEDLQLKEDLSYTPVVLSGQAIAHYAKSQVAIFRVRVCTSTCC